MNPRPVASPPCCHSGPSWGPPGAAASPWLPQTALNLCCGLDVCTLPTPVFEPSPRCEGIRRWALGDQDMGWGPEGKISPALEETQRDGLSPSMSSQREGRHSQTRERASWTPTLRAPGRTSKLQTREKSRLLLPRLVRGTFVTQQPLIDTTSQRQPLPPCPPSSPLGPPGSHTSGDSRCLEQEPLPGPRPRRWGPVGGGPKLAAGRWVWGPLLPPFA